MWLIDLFANWSSAERVSTCSSSYLTLMMICMRLSLTSGDMGGADDG